MKPFVTGQVQLFVEFHSLETLLEAIEGQFKKGRAFIAGHHELNERQECELVLIHPLTGEWMPLQAEAVYFTFEPEAGVGVQLREPSHRLSEILMNFAQNEREKESFEADAGLFDNDESNVLDEDALSLVEDTVAEETEEPLSVSQGRALSTFEKVRSLDVRGRERTATKGTLAERIALERVFGSLVWESLLSNPNLTGPEVAKIAKNGAVSQPILNTMMSASAWIAKPEVRRALLSNPRLSETHAERLLRSLSLSELRIVPRQTAYPMKVRNSAKKLLPR